MERITIADVNDSLSDVVRRVEAGDTVEILRDGKPAARVVAPPPRKVKVDIAMLEALHAKIPMQGEPAGDFIRRLRDDARY